ncbi:MAG: hypothetical protein E7211_09210 [Clostridium lundense]|nr:hypothetical protein [Clostridium lundense]
MNKKVVVFKATFVFLSLFSLYSNINIKAYSNLAQNYYINVLDGIYADDEKRLVAEIPNSNIKLYYVQYDEVEGRYRGFILEINDVKKYFEWENVDNTSRKPELILSDLNKDGKNELVVILNKGYGTGVQDEEVHVIKQDLFFYEILVENPLISLHKNVHLENSPEQVIIILNNKKTVLNKRGMTALPYEDLGAGYGHHIGFEVNNNILYSRVLLGVGTNPGVGEFIIKYIYKDEIFQVQSIDFIPRSEYLSK